MDSPTPQALQDPISFFPGGFPNPLCGWLLAKTPDGNDVARSARATSSTVVSVPTPAQYLSVLRRALMDEALPAGCALRLSTDGLRVCVGDHLAALSVRLTLTHPPSSLRRGVRFQRRWKERS
jgi:hypothetical protein